MNTAILTIHYKNKQDAGWIGYQQLIFFNMNDKIRTESDLKCAIAKAVTNWLTKDATGIEYAEKHNSHVHYKDFISLLMDYPNLKNRLYEQKLVLVQDFVTFDCTDADDMIT